jgi:NAD-dependent dihydropyrimidine dehydrogenase PreA subunit
MAIDPKNLAKSPVKQHNGHAVRGIFAPPKQLGIHGTQVAVDQDACIGCGSCASTCPVKLYDMIESKGHPKSAQKSDPVREKECILCRACEAVCPVKCILISPRK